jgi:hypothetical protein
VADDIVQLARDPGALGGDIGLPGDLQLLQSEGAPPKRVTDGPRRCQKRQKKIAGPPSLNWGSSSSWIAVPSRMTGPRARVRGSL